MIDCVKCWQMPTHSPEDELVYGNAKPDRCPGSKSPRNQPLRSCREGRVPAPRAIRCGMKVLGRIVALSIQSLNF